MNTSSAIHIPVKMGSHRMVFNLQNDANAPHRQLTSQQLVDHVLKRCRLNRSTNVARTYAMFESVNGVERLVNANECVIELQAKWSNHSNAEFVIRKFHPVEKKLTSPSTSTSSSSSSLNEQRIRKCYKKLKAAKKIEQIQREQSNKQELNNIYEQINEDNKENATVSADVVQLNYLKQVLQNEMKLKRQAKKLQQARELRQKEKETEPKQCAFHEEKLSTNLNAKLVENINFLKFLHFKLKVSNKTTNKNSDETTVNERQQSRKKLFAYKRMVNVLNSSGASDETSSQSSSTSTLESLV
jgi:hypothetical protein